MQLDRPETGSRHALDARQLSQFNALLAEVYARNPFWQARLKDAGISGQPLTALQQLQDFPLLTKTELVEDQQRHPPFGSNLTYRLTRYSRLHQTSGTTGQPMRWLDTPQSWDWLMECWAQIYRLVEVKPEDVFAFPFSFGPFIGFWAAFEGAQRIGNLSLTMGGMSSESRLKMICEMKATIVCCTPTYALRLADVAAQEGIPLADSSVRMLILAGEPGGSVPAIRERIQRDWGARVIDHWGMTDIGSLGIETVQSPGSLTILEAQCIPEIIDPETALPVEPGQLGELVITNLGRWGQPVIRYRTGDLVRATATRSADGLAMLQLEGGILGRTDDMVTIRGNNVFPSSLDAVLRECDEVAEYRTTVVTRKSMPHLRIEIEPVFPAADHPERAQHLLGMIERLIKNRLNFQAEVTAVESLPRFELKARRFFREDR
ncbi:phenylacetate--CoA ligase family protein [Planctomicrobium sp. SH661]|uniref:phenylacetate--CoA ligase family protein n=1 Tax=Planctomicrobium sp. SH661 TaxID=3448124 RepID=UPI003F5B913D